MSEILKTNNIRKKVIRNSTIIFFTVILLLTFFSKTINNFLLPIVEVVPPEEGNLRSEIVTIGEVGNSDTEKIVAHGNWRITEIKVKEGEEVKKGKILANIDLNSIEIERKRMEIEISRLENDFEDYKVKFEANDYNIPKIEFDIAKADREIKRLEEEQKSLDELYNAGSENYNNVKEARRRLKDAKDNYENLLMLLSSKKLEKKNNSSEYTRNVKQKELEIELQKLKLANFNKSVPRNGQIESNTDGKIKAILVQRYSAVGEGQVVFEVAKTSIINTVTWLLSETKSKAVMEGDLVTLNVMIPEEKTITTVVVKKEYLSKERMFKFTAFINASEIKLTEGQQVDVKIVKESKKYKVLIPNSSIIERSGAKYIFLLSEREGIFGKEFYAKEVEVKFIEGDDSNSSISNELDLEKDKVISYSSKVLEDATQVKLK